MEKTHPSTTALSLISPKLQCTALCKLQVSHTQCVTCQCSTKVQARSRGNWSSRMVGTGSYLQLLWHNPKARTTVCCQESQEWLDSWCNSQSKHIAFDGLFLLIFPTTNHSPQFSETSSHHVAYLASILRSSYLSLSSSVVAGMCHPDWILHFLEI